MQITNILSGSLYIRLIVNGVGCLRCEDDTERMLFEVCTKHIQFLATIYRVLYYTSYVTIIYLPGGLLYFYMLCWIAGLLLYTSLLIFLISHPHIFGLCVQGTAELFRTSIRRLKSLRQNTSTRGDVLPSLGGDGEAGKSWGGPSGAAGTGQSDELNYQTHVSDV